MIVSELELSVMQLCHYFVVKKGYRTIQLQGFAEELWMFHPHAKEFSLIRIAKQPLQPEDIIRVNQIRSALSKALRVHQATLNICFSPTVFEEEFVDGMKTIGIDFAHKQPSPLEQYFEGVSGVFFPSNDIINDFHRIKKEIELAAQKQAKHHFRDMTIKDLPVVSIGIVALCVMLWLLASFLIGNYQESTNVGIVVGAYYRTFVVANHEYWRFLTAGFVHLDFFHLLMNVVSLLNVGVMVEKYYGKARYLAIVLLSIVVGTIFAHLDQSTTVVLGLSAGVYGAFGAFLVIMVNSKAIRNRQLQRQLANIIVINLVISLMPGVSLSGHLGGFIAGVIGGILLIPKAQWGNLQLNMAIAGSILIAFLGYQIANPKPLLELYPGTDIPVIEIYDDLGMHSYANRLVTALSQLYQGEMQ